MRQILIRIPYTVFGFFPDGIPIYGYGLMLFLAFLICTWLAGRRARKDGIAPEAIQDLAIWIFVVGILGARITFMMVERRGTLGERLRAVFSLEILRIWEGGLVYYGSLAGGVIGFFLAYFFVLRKQKIGLWQAADVIAPAAALGLCLGRIGCLLNGCCYGDVAACDHCLSVKYPFSSEARRVYTQKGIQTAAGFTLQSNFPLLGLEGAMVSEVEMDSPADKAGLRPGDAIIQVDDVPIKSNADLDAYLVRDWPLSQNDLRLTVSHGDGTEEQLPSFQPRTVPLHATQIYESITAFLLFLLMTAYYPFRTRAGTVMLIFLYLYPIHRILDETLRNDTDPVAYGLTFSQVGSLLVLAMAVIFTIWIWRQPSPVPTTTQR